MKCPNCHQENEGGNFCDKCGTRLNEPTETDIQQQSQPQKQPLEQAVTSTSHSEDYLKKTKNHSKQYVTYFMDVIKHPYASIHETMGNQHFMYAIITLALFSLFIPLSIYFGLKGIVNRLNSFGTYGYGSYMDVEVPFGEIVIKPFVAIAVFMVIVAVFAFLAVKLGQANTTFKEVLTRYGILLIPFVFLVAIGLILSILKVSLFILFLVLGSIGAVYIVVPMIIAFYKKSAPNDGLDAVYGTMLTYLLIALIIYVMGEMAFNSILSNLETLFNGF